MENSQSHLNLTIMPTLCVKQMLLDVILGTKSLSRALLLLKTIDLARTSRKFNCFANHQERTHDLNNSKQDSN